MTTPFESWYAGKRVFLTGHTGFKGAWLSAWLQAIGAEVTGYALAAEPGALFEAAEIGAGMRSIIGDVRDAAHLSQALAEARPDVVIHMAAQSLVRPSYDDPVGTFSTNVMGTAILLDACRRVDTIRSIVVVTSDKCYENDGSGVAFTETAPMGGSDPYSASKGCTELVATSFERSFFADGATRLVSGRAGNVIGGGDWSVDRIIPDLARSARTGEPVVIRRPDAVRPWQHVLEPLRGYLMLGHRAATASDPASLTGGWNFGPSIDDAVPVRAIVECCTELWPAIRTEFATQQTGPHEASLLMLDCTKAARGLDWHPVLPLDAGLTLTMDWYREASADPAGQSALTARQIATYRARIAEPATVAVH